MRSLYLWACERLYHELASAYDAVAWSVSLGAWEGWQRAALPFCRPGRLLELGYGTGALLAQMARAGRDVVGLERSGPMERVAEQRLARKGIEAARLRADARRIPLADGAFATVLATFPAPYLLEAETLAEIARVLEPGGLLVAGGMWVTPRSTILSALPFVYAPRPTALLARLDTHIEAAGLRPTWCEAAAGDANVGLLLAEKVA